MSAAGRRGNLILSVAEDYEWRHVRPFLESLRATDFDGDVRFFAAGMPRDSVERVERAGAADGRPRRFRVRVRGHVFRLYDRPLTRVRWHVQPAYRHVLDALSRLGRDRETTRARILGVVANTDVARHCFYLDHLLRVGHEYDNVMLSDVRDVVFLGDPFDFDIGDSMYCFAEAESFTIDKQVNNRGWLIGAYGEAALRELGDRPILCAGVTIGRTSAVIAYLRLMIDQLARLPRQPLGVDQGVHNYLVHKGLVPNARLVGNREGAVLTVGLMSEAEAAAALEERAHEIRVVHQYDRHPHLLDVLSSLSHTSV